MPRRNSSRPHHLPEEELVGIFLRLPLESVIRSRLVSKLWKSLTSTSGFVKDHMDFKGNRQYLLVNGDNRSAVADCWLLNIEDGKVQHVPAKNPTINCDKIGNSCNGLLCLHFGGRFNPTYLYNPILRESFTLPLFQSDRGRNKFKRYGDHQVVVGFDVKANVYKVVRTFRDLKRENRHHFHMINVAGGAWERIDPPDCDWFYSLRECECWNGSLFWILFDELESEPRAVLAFDLDVKTFKVLSFPQEICQSMDSLRLDPLLMGERLVFVENDGSKTRLWKVVGTSIDDYSLSLEEEHDTCWEQGMNQFHRAAGEVRGGGILWEVGFRHIHYAKFLPGAPARYERIEIRDLPSDFHILPNCKPTLISPGPSED